NAAFSYGGIPLAVNTIENFIGTRIDHGAIVDFQSFKGLTDALGGVTVNNTVPFQSSHSSGHFFDEGNITLNGEEALIFVRERYAFQDGDYQRVRNQQTYMKGLAGGLLSRDTLLNPVKLSNTFEALQPYLLVDEELTLPKVLGLGASASGLRVDDFSFFTSPTYGIGQSADGQSIVLPNEEELVTVREHFLQGTLHEYVPLPDY
ncbi:MAG TPA: LCP family protein, partial [Microbacteriaceae bacterium]|nr:LCP family protein [Microbacteriaceae bacterium]